LPTAANADPAAAVIVAPAATRSVPTKRFRTHRRNPDSFIANNGPVTSLDDENLLIYQTYDLTRIKNGHVALLLDDAPVVPSPASRKSPP